MMSGLLAIFSLGIGARVFWFFKTRTPKRFWADNFSPKTFGARGRSGAKPGPTPYQKIHFTFGHFIGLQACQYQLKSPDQGINVKWSSQGGATRTGVTRSGQAPDNSGMCNKKYSSNKSLSGFFRHLLLILIFMFQAPLWLSADYVSFPDLYEVKLELKDKLLGGVVNLYRSTEEVYQLGYNRKVKFMIVRKKQDDQDFIFASFLWFDIDSYPYTKQGNVSLKRNLDNGGFEYYTLILRDESDCYLRLTPQGERTVMDIYLFGYHLYRNLMIPLPFQKAIFLSFDELKQISGKAVDWDFLLYNKHTPGHGHLESLARDIGSRLSGLGDNEDGAIDEQGQWVYIENLGPQQGETGLNCSGFAKWVVDGFYNELFGKNMAIDPLKIKHPESRGSRWVRPLEKEYDLYFALDWTRNLATGFYQSRYPSISVNNIEFRDVDDVPLVRYVDDVGYKMEQLYLALFYLAQKDQGHIYLGAVNRSWELDPQQLIYFHVVVLIPYFDQQGHFQVKLFERQEDNRVKNLAVRYPGNYIHLVRVDALGEFDYDSVSRKTPEMDQ